MEIFKASVAETIKDLHEGLTNMGWKLCVDENGKADNSFKLAARNEDMVGKSIVVFKPYISPIIAPKPKTGELKHSYTYDLMVVKIVHIKLEDFDDYNGKRGYLLCPQFEYEGKSRTVHLRLDMYSENSLEDWHLVAFERTNAKLTVIIHRRGRASAHAPPRKTMRIQAPHTTPRWGLCHA